jgi:carbon storage regulator
LAQGSDCAKEGISVLVLSRRVNQSIKIGDDIEIMIIEVRGDQVRVGVNAPRDVTVHRKEVYLQIQQENVKAASASANGAEMPEDFDQFLQLDIDTELS